MKILCSVCFFISWLWPITAASAATPMPPPGAVVHAILFHSPTCGHCHYVIEEVLPSLFEQYGRQLQMIAVDITQPDGQALFIATLQKFNLDRAGVPFLVVGDTYLIGDMDIPGRFPNLIKQYLAQGGVDWPDIPGLVVALPTAQNTPQPAPTPEPSVHAVLFYRSSCGHCQQLIEEMIPPLFQEYGSQLQIFGIDVSFPEGDVLYDAAIAHFNINIAHIGVPTLVVGDHVLVGLEIQREFPAIIEQLLAQGGIGWPEIPGLLDALASAQATATPLPAYSTPANNSVGSTDSPEPGSYTATPGLLLAGEHSSGPLSNFALDPLGSSLAVIILLGMMASLVWGIVYLCRSTGAVLIVPNWLIPALCMVGLGVAGYLAYVETAQVEAICGPVGDCNTVQQSEYARLFGILPIGVLGMAGHIMIITAWLISRRTKGRTADYAALAMLSMTAFGTLFSIYLTFLEPFVIGASCLWCLTSAVLMTALFYLNIAPGKLAYTHLFKKPGDPAIPG